jgi:LysM repeat protein
MIAQQILANFSNDADYKTWVDEISSDSMNYESPFGAASTSTGETPSAQSISNAYMLMKQRKPMVMEFYKKNIKTSEIELKSMTMYINPDKMQISNSKVIAKQQTRGGIFYHFWGDDHSMMSISGTTGLAGMAGIKQLEEIYFASGSLLGYNNYTPTQIYGSVIDYKVLNYSDPISVMDTVSNSNYSQEMIDAATHGIYTYQAADVTNKDQVNVAYNCMQCLNIYKDNSELSLFLTTDLPAAYAKLQSWDGSSTEVGYREYYQYIYINLINIFKDIDDTIMQNMAYELSLEKIYANLPKVDQTTVIDNTQKDTISSMYSFQSAQNEALKNHIESIHDFRQRDKNINDLLRSGFINLTMEMKDEWLPRQITIYFDGRAYIGHFENFNYSRDAASNLITYDMKFVITKQYEFDNQTDATTNSMTAITTPNAAKSAVVITPVKVVVVPKPDKNLYTVVIGDTLRNISSKFYGNGELWPQIYSANLNKILNPEQIYPGQQFVIPELPSGYKTWVVIAGDTLSSIAKRFYGDGSKSKKIWDANIETIGSNPNLIYPKQILKIPI